LVLGVGLGPLGVGRWRVVLYDEAIGVDDKTDDFTLL